MSIWLKSSVGVTVGVAVGVDVGVAVTVRVIVIAGGEVHWGEVVGFSVGVSSGPAQLAITPASRTKDISM
jgi:hypothetical protein